MAVEVELTLNSEGKWRATQGATIGFGATQQEAVRTLLEVVEQREREDVRIRAQSFDSGYRAPIVEMLAKLGDTSTP